MVEPLLEDDDADRSSDKRIATNKGGKGGGQASLAKRNLLEQECSEFADPEKRERWQEAEESVVIRQVRIDDFQHHCGGAE